EAANEGAGQFIVGGGGVDAIAGTVRRDGTALVPTGDSFTCGDGTALRRPSGSSSPSQTPSDLPSDSASPSESPSPSPSPSDSSSPTAGPTTPGATRGPTAGPTRTAGPPPPPPPPPTSSSSPPPPPPDRTPPAISNVQASEATLYPTRRPDPTSIISAVVT